MQSYDSSVITSNPREYGARVSTITGFGYDFPASLFQAFRLWGAAPDFSFAPHKLNAWNRLLSRMPSSRKNSVYISDLATLGLLCSFLIVWEREKPHMQSVSVRLANLIRHVRQKQYNKLLCVSYRLSTERLRLKIMH